MAIMRPNTSLEQQRQEQAHQLDKAREVSTQLQILLKDSERRQDLLLGRCTDAEEQLARVKGERDLLLGLVNKFSSSSSATFFNPRHS